MLGDGEGGRGGHEGRTKVWAMKTKGETALDLYVRWRLASPVRTPDARAAHDEASAHAIWGAPLPDAIPPAQN